MRKTKAIVAGKPIFEQEETTMGVEGEESKNKDTHIQMI